ncbi:hypothetical protein CLD22_13705 [Rubrivivax gelatinosus]|nr:hypothetical protein [Rubrivivax gelatinosus]
MARPIFDADALITMFENATATQGEQLRGAVTQATLAALQGRELTLKNLRATLKAVGDAAGAGAARNTVAGVEPTALLDSVVSGLDAAVLKAVEANRVALQRLVQQGADLREKHLKKALDDLDRMEDTLFSALKKSAEGSGATVASAWGPVLERLQAGGTMSGMQATLTTEQITQQMQDAVRTTRHASLRAAQALADSYTAMVSGVLIGMSEALQAGAPAAAAAEAAPARKTAARRRSTG